MIEFDNLHDYFHFIMNYEGELVLKKNKVYSGDNLIAILHYKGERK